VLLPSSAFEQLARLQIEYPMLFELRSAKGRTHCGVLEFTAPEGNCYVPFWMMQNLMLEEGGLLSVKSASLPKATFVKFKPQSSDFLDISNPRAVLEKQLRTFSCVTVGDQICLPLGTVSCCVQLVLQITCRYNNKRFYLEVQEVKPKEAACIIECDCNVDFDIPVGYSEPEYAGEQSPSASQVLPTPQKALSQTREDEANWQVTGAFKAFAGGGQRLDGKELKSTQAVRLEAMPKQFTAEQTKVWQSPGMSCAGAADCSSKFTNAQKPKLATTKWAKTSKAAFTCSGKPLK